MNSFFVENSGETMKFYFDISLLKVGIHVKNR